MVKINSAVQPQRDPEHRFAEQQVNTLGLKF